MNNLNSVNLFNKNDDFLHHISDYLSLCVSKICLESKSGHLGASLSSADLMTVLYFGGFLRFSINDARHPDRDRVLLRGHLGPLRYPLFSLLGWVNINELSTYRFLNSRLQGHECMFDLPGVDITPSGSLGMVLSYAVGSSIVSKQRNHKFKTWVFLGDGEEQEGNVSEAARHAANLKLNNLICVMDKNGKQLSRPTNDMNSLSDISTIWRGYGWNVIEIDGHNISEIKQAYNNACNYKAGPTLIIANTIKGKGLEGTEDNFCGYHTISNCPHNIVREFISKQEDKLSKFNISREKIISEIYNNLNNIEVNKTDVVQHKYIKLSLDSYKDINQHDAVKYYYHLLAKHIKDNNIDNFYFLTADLMQKDSIKECHLQDIKNYYDVGLREQHMYAMAHGISITDPNARIHINTTEAFSFRALDQIHAASQGKSKMIITADKSGIGNARNGSTHQSISQSFSYNWLNNVRFLEPADAEDYFACMNHAFSKNDFLYYIRCHSINCENLPKIDFKSNEFTAWYEIGNYKVINPDIILIGSGITSTFLYKCSNRLIKEGIKARIINITAPSLLNSNFAAQFVRGKPCLCVYNGHPDFLPSCISSVILKYGQENIPNSIDTHGFVYGCSGTIEQLIQKFGFDEDSLINKIKLLIGKI